MSTPWRLRVLFLAFAAVLVPIGVAVRRHDDFSGNWPSSALYEWLLMCLVLAIRPQRSFVWPTAIVVAAATVALEFAQLWQPPWLQEIRGTFLGRMTLGTSFSWADLPAYPLACVVAALLLRTVWPAQTAADGASRSAPA